MKRRHEFELSLIRRIPRKSDFLQYASYEMELEMLRRKRAARLSEFAPRVPHKLFD